MVFGGFCIKEKVKIMDYCYHCMAEITHPENPYCPQCGEEHNVYYSQSFELPAGTYLCDKRYFVGRSLGSGGFGITYLGFDVKINKKIVIKETFYSGIFKRNSQNITLSEPLKVEYDSTILLSEIMNKTQKECFCLSRAESFNNIVKVYDWFAENNTAYIITEFINGDTLFDRVAKNGVYSWNELYAKFKPLMMSLSQLHKMDLLHRDIKPHNIMLRQVFKSKEDFVLIDFGLARSNQKNTLATVSAFTPGYSPFEQRSLTKKDGTYTDVYALAATMYYALTGASPNDEVVGDVHDDFPELRVLRSSGKISEQVYKAFVSALQPNFRHRCQTIDEFIEKIEDESEEFETPIESPYNRNVNAGAMQTQYAGSSSPYEEELFSEPDYSGGRTSYAEQQNVPQRNFNNYQTQPPIQQPVYVTVQQPSNSGKGHGFANFMLCLCIIVLLVALVALLDALDLTPLPDFLPLDSYSERGNDDDNSNSDIDLSGYVQLEDYSGRNFEEVKAELEDKGFEVRYRTIIEPSLDDGSIVSQDFDGSKLQPKGKTLNFVVSRKDTSSQKTESKEESKSESKAESKAESKVESKVESKAESKPQVTASEENVSSEEEVSSAPVESEESGSGFTDNAPNTLKFKHKAPVFDYSRVSSKLASQGSYTYGEQNVLQRNDGLCWAEGVDGVGIGEYFEFYTPTVQTVSQCSLINGYTIDSERFYNNGRLSEVTFEFSDGSSYKYKIDPDSMSEQTFYFPREIQTTSIKVIISDAVAGDKYEDTCISFILAE